MFEKVTVKEGEFTPRTQPYDDKLVAEIQSALGR
jgi:hypothetical protein